MPDIFDEIAPDSAAGGDIFDQVATPGDIDPFSPDQNNLRRVMQNFPNERAQRVWDQPTVSPEELIKRQTWKDLSAADKLAVDAIRLERGFKSTAAAAPKGLAVLAAQAGPFPREVGMETAESIKAEQDWHNQQAAKTPEQIAADISGHGMTGIGTAIERTIPESPQPSNVNRPLGAALEGAGSLGASMAMAPAGAVPMMQGMFLMELSDAYESEIARQKDTGEPLNPGKASAKASLYAAGAIPLEYIGGAGRLARRWFGTAAENEVRELARKGGGEAVLAFFSERAKDAALEGGTESLQRLWQDAIVHGKPNIAAALQEGASAAGGSLLLGGVAQGTRLAGHKAGQAFSEARSNENIDRVLQESGQQIALEQSFPPGFAPPIDPAETSGNVFDIFDEVASESQSPQETAQASSGLVTKVTPAAAAATPAPAGASANVGRQTMVHAEPPLNRQQSQVRTELEALPGGRTDLRRTVPALTADQAEAGLKDTGADTDQSPATKADLMALADFIQNGGNNPFAKPATPPQPLPGASQTPTVGAVAGPVPAAVAQTQGPTPPAPLTRPPAPPPQTPDPRPQTPDFAPGQKVAVRLSNRSRREHLGQLIQIQPDGSATVKLDGEKVYRTVARNQYQHTKAEAKRLARQAEAAGLTDQQKADATEFDRLVEDYAPQMEWAPGEAYDRNTAMQEQGVENARLRAAAAQAAMRAVLPGGQSTSLEDKAAAMPKLTAYLKAQFPGDNSIDQRRVLEQFGRTDETQTPAPAEQSARAGEDAQALRRITAQNPDVPELRNLGVHPAAGRVAPAGPPGQLGGHTGRPRRISAPEQKALRELERLFGVRIIVVDSPGARPFNGYKDRKSNVILIHAGTEKLLLSVAGHELLHHLRLTHPALYDELKAALWPLMQNTAQFRVRLERRGQAKADMAEELIADFVGDNLARPGFWATLKQREPDLFTRVARIVRAWLDKLLARLKSVPGFSSDPYFTDLEQARHVVASALVDAARETQFAARGVPGRETITAGEALFSKPEGDLFGRPRMSPAEIAADAYKNFPFKGTDVLDADFILPDGKMLLVDDPKFAGAYHQVVADKYGYSGDYRTGAAQFSSDLSAIRFHYSTWRAEPVLSFSWSGGLTSFQRAAIAKIMSAAKEKSERFEVRIEHEVFEGRKLGRGQERILDTPAQSSVFAFMEAQPKTAKEIFAYKDYNPYAAVGPFDPYGPDTDPPQQASAPYGDELFSKPEGDLFGAPESVAEQRERIKNEELKIKKARAREQMSGRAGARLTAEDLDTTTEMFGAEVRQDKAGQGSLFSKPERPAGASLRITPANLRGELSPMQRTLFAEPASVSVLNEWRKQAFQEIQAAGFVPREVGSLVSWVGQDGKILVQLQKQTHPDAINPRAHGQSMREADAAQIAEAVAMVRQRQSKRGNKIVHSQTAASGSRYLSALIDGRPWMVRLATHSERTSDSSIMLGDKIRQKHLERLAPGEVANHLEIITNDPGAVTWKEVQEKAREQRLDENENTSESGASRTIAGDSLKSASPNQIQTESRMVTGDENQPQTPSSDKSGSLRMGQDVSEGGLFSKPDPSPEFAQLQTRIAGAEAELMAAIRQHIKPPEGMTKAKALAAKNAAVSKLNRLLAEQLKQMTSATVDAARSPEQTAELIAQTVSLLNHAQDEIATHTARSEAIPAGLTQLRQDLQTRLNVLKGWTEDQTDLAANGQPATRSAPKGRDLRKRNLESATDGGRKGIGDFWNSLKAGLRYLTSPIPELPLTGERAEKSALFRRGYRLFAVENNAVRAEAAEKINRVLEPLTKLGRKGADNAVLREYYHLGTARQRAAMNPAQLAKIDARMAALEAELNKDPFDLFRRLVLYRDLFWRGSFLKNEQGKPITLPEGLTVEDVQVELARLTKLISEHKDGLAITEALRRHYALTDELQKSILAHGEIIPESLRNPLYFPHHVIDHWTGNFARVRATTEEDFRKYLIAPTGSGALIQTDYLKAMMLHTADVLAHNARIDLVQKYWQPYDISEQLKDEHGANWNKPWNIPPGYKVFTPYKKLPLRMDYILSREVMAEKLGVLFNDGDLRERLGESGLVLKVKPEDLHAALVAGEKIQWALPSEITDALNGIARREAAAANPGLGHALGKPFRALNNFWKKTTLFAPWNWIRYEYGNLSTDAIDKVLAADPGVAKHMARAARELWQSDKGPQSPEFKAAAREGVFETITAGEAGELGRLPQFKPFLTPGEARWDNVRTVLATPMRGSKFREGVFRYAKFLADVERLRAGKEPVYAGAFHGDIEALGEDVDGQRRLLDGDELIFAKAAEISLKTYGDYQSLSVVGQWVREYAVPFWSWQDVNFRYHANQLRNIADGIKGVPGGTERTAALRYAGIRVVSTLLAVGIAKELWNQFGGVAMGLWDEDDDLESKLSEADRRRGHLLLGKDDKGQVKVVYTPSAWSDVAEWMGGQNMKRLFMEYVRGQITLNQFVRDYAKQLPMDVGNKAAQSAGPLLKAPYELASGQATFPDVFDQRQIPKADKWWRFVGGLTDQRVVATLRAAFDQDYYSQPAREQLQQIILQIRRRDPEQWAYYEAREDASDWKEAKTGKRFEHGSYNAPEALALRNFRKSIYRGDVANAERFYNRLIQFGYTAERLDASIRNQHPLSNLNAAARAEYTRTLTPRQQLELELANKYYSRIKALDQRERLLFKSKQVPNRAPNPELLRRIVEDQSRNK